MDTSEPTENSTADKLFNFALAYHDKRNALYLIGDLLDSGDVTLEKAQLYLDKVVPGTNLPSLADEYKAKWWQQKGWKGVMRRFSKKHKK